MIMKIYICLFISVGIILSSCQKLEDEYRYNIETVDNWSAVADTASDALITSFWNEEGYFNYGSDNSDMGFQYWPNAHAMDVVIDAYERTDDSKYLAYFDPWYEGIFVKNGNTYLNPFYDDMQWIALTMLRMYEVTDQQKYLNTVLFLWEDIIDGWEESFADGGISWVKYQRYSKNACSNGPASLLATRLYQLTQEQEYLDWAIKIYEWQKNTLYNRSTGAVYDNIDGNTGQVNTVTLTYNQGTFLGTAVNLYLITGERLYLNDAQKIANFTVSKCIDAATNLLRNEGIGDNALFKVIFVRYFLYLLDVHELDQAYRNKFENFLNHNVTELWFKGRNIQGNLFGPAWDQVELGNVQLTAQASACMTIEAKARFIKK